MRAPSQTSALQPETQLLPDTEEAVRGAPPRSPLSPLRFSPVPVTGPPFPSNILLARHLIYLRTAVPLTSILARRLTYHHTAVPFTSILARRLTYLHTAVPLTSILARRSIYLIIGQSFQCTLLFARCPNPNVTFGSFVF